jgi:hypothetical protein
MIRVGMASAPSGSGPDTIASLGLLRVLAALLIVALAFGHAPAAQDEHGVAQLLHDLEAAIKQGSPEALVPLLANDFDRATLRTFTAAWLTPGLVNAVVHERDRTAEHEGGRLRLVLEVLLEHPQTARMLTWQATAAESDGRWRFSSLQSVASLEGLHRLQLDTSRQFRADNLKITAEDFELVLDTGDVFACTAPAGTTALVLLGKGRMIFRPAPETERRQLELFDGKPALQTRFRAAFLRLNPFEYGSRVTTNALREVPVAKAVVESAQQVFQEESPKSYGVDLGELSRDAWSLLPSHGDFLAEVRTRRFGTLTYVQASDEYEDISLFDRAARRNISVYASRAKLAERGPFYDEDDNRSFDVLDYNVDVAFAPDRLWFDGRGVVKARIRQNNVASVSLRLNGALAIRSVSTDKFGRVLFLRVKNQDSLVVNLPSPVHEGTELAFTVVYSGRLEPQGVDREALGQSVVDITAVDLEPSFVYSNRSYWYPQPAVSDYASASIRMTVPAGYSAVCSGVPAEGSPVQLTSGTPRQLFVFTTSQPVRYLGCALARFSPIVQQTRIRAPQSARRIGTDGSSGVQLTVHTTGRLRSRGPNLLAQLEDVAQFYATLMNDAPYAAFTLAVVESHTPGGHSPAYFAAYNQPLPGSPLTWAHDPTTFENYPEFFLAHEVAHQWWGHGIGWQNYHEQWLSEGFAQYFAALYAEKRRGPAVFGSIIRDMSEWAIRASPQGPVYLGYRLGHLKRDSRVLRALIYNKGAMVLHMLRRLVGDEAFFQALRRFYADHRFTKVGTDDLRRTFEAETGFDLTRFFERWIYGWTLPTLAYSSNLERDAGQAILRLRFTQEGTIFDFPVTVTLELKDGSSRYVIIPIRERVVEYRIPIPEGSLRRFRVNRDLGALIGSGS